MERITKIAAINLLILVAYSLGIGFGNRGEHFAIMVFIMSLVAIQLIVNLVLGIIQYVKGNKSLGHTFMISLALIAALGPAACYAALKVYRSVV